MSLSHLVWGPLCLTEPSSKSRIYTLTLRGGKNPQTFKMSFLIFHLPKKQVSAHRMTYWMFFRSLSLVGFKSDFSSAFHLLGWLDLWNCETLLCPECDVQVSSPGRPERSCHPAPPGVPGVAVAVLLRVFGGHRQPSSSSLDLLWGFGEMAFSLFC